MDRTVWENGNKPRGILDLNLENVIGIVITLKIAEEELLYIRGMCKDPEGYTFLTTLNSIYIHNFTQKCIMRNEYKKCHKSFYKFCSQTLRVNNYF